MELKSIENQLPMQQGKFNFIIVTAIQKGKVDHYRSLQTIANFNITRINQIIYAVVVAVMKKEMRYFFQFCLLIAISLESE